jgi:hypothetical protein
LWRECGEKPDGRHVHEIVTGRLLASFRDAGSRGSDDLRRNGLKDKPRVGRAKKRSLRQSVLWKWRRQAPMRAAKRLAHELGIGQTGLVSRFPAEALMSDKISPLAPKKYPKMPAVEGVRIATAEAGIKYKNRTDLLAMVFDEGTTVAGVFTKSKCPSAPVDFCRQNLGRGKARILVVNSGNANAFTGKKGRETTALTGDAAAKARPICKLRSRRWHAS